MSDIPAIRALARVFEGVAVEYFIEERFGPVGGTTWVERKADELEAEVRANIENVLVAEVDGRVVGFVTTAYDSRLRTGRIPNLAVAEDMQGRGIGKKLLQAAYKHLKEKGAKWLRIETLTTNERGQRFYTKLGFQEVARKIYYCMPIERWQGEEQ